MSDESRIALPEIAFCVPVVVTLTQQQAAISHFSSKMEPLERCLLDSPPGQMGDVFNGSFSIKEILKVLLDSR